jgi:hypothetical protein
VKNTNATFGVRHRLGGHWEAGVHGGGSQADTSLFQFSNEKIESLVGGIDISRPLRGGSVLHISYENMHELSKGTLASIAGFDRDQVTLGIDCRLKSIFLGR